MHPEVNNWLQLIFRWIHVVAGITWIGHLYFFNWVNGPLQAKLDGPTKKIVNPELMPRALYWFRWGAAWTWITGILLAGLVYYHANNVFESEYPGNRWLWLAVFLIMLAVGFVLYNLVMKKVANLLVANTISLLLFAGFYAVLELCGHFNGRALYIHSGAILGTMMALNVWMIIWPAQRRIITAVKNGTAPDAADVKNAGQRSRHNTFMSVPLVFTMLSNHYPTVYANEYRDVILAVIIAVGFAATSILYKRAAKVQGF